MKETEKLNSYRKNNNYDKFFSGVGIDIGCGNDLLSKEIFTNIKQIDPYDIKDGDATYCKNIENEKYNFVYSSHCLEHLQYPYLAFQNWLRICKYDGYIIVAVPHEIFYEKCLWPSRWNSEHLNSFTLEWESNLPKSINIPNFLAKFNHICKTISMTTILHNFDFNNFMKDQTRSDAICQIEFIVQKKI
jgi:predicted SAM-dependent methyltransferase